MILGKTLHLLTGGVGGVGVGGVGGGGGSGDDGILAITETNSK